jgi:hypothetical protein
VAQNPPTVTISGSGFAPGDTVTATVYSNPIALGSRTADSNGNVSFTFTPTAALDAGGHRVELAGTGVTASATLTVAKTTSALANTGANQAVTTVGAAGLAALLMGATCLALPGLRRRPYSHN